ncbi:MAG: S41 family peptidase [Bacteroidota bacterium]
MRTIVKYALFSCSFVVIGMLVGFGIKGSIPAELNSGLRKFNHALRFIEANYVDEPVRQEMIDDAIRGITKGMGPHTNYFTAAEMQKMREDMVGSYEGIGVRYNILEDTIYVEAPISGGPSEKLGIMAGDRIIKVDDRNVAGINITDADVLRYLKGPKGTTVKVMIRRRGEKELLPFEITRDRIPLNSLDFAYMIRPKTGYIKINRFAETTYAEFREALENLLSEGMENLILDLRDNPGGLMEMGRKVADEFIEQGKLIVRTEGRRNSTRQKYMSTSNIGSFEAGGLVILQNYGSASASEIVAGAVQDHDRGLIMGVRSFGKGLVQYQEDFEDGSAMRLVISKFYTPSGRCIQKPFGESDEDYYDEINQRFASGEIYDESKIDVPDSLKFSTTSGRTVYGGGGIVPDMFVARDTSQWSDYLTLLRSNDVFRAFAAQYVDDRPQLTEQYPDWRSFVRNFQVSNRLLDQFVVYAKNRDIPAKPDQLERSFELIKNRVKALIGRRLYGDEAFYPVWMEADQVVQQAIKSMPAAIALQKEG